MVFYEFLWYIMFENERDECNMEIKPMKILVIEDDVKDCNNFLECEKTRKDIKIVAITDSDIKGLEYVKSKQPEGIVLDLELNNSESGSTDSFEFLDNLKKLKLSYEPIVIVTTHINSKRTYEILHKKGVELIMYKDHPNYSSNNVFNKLISLRKVEEKAEQEKSLEEILQDEEEKLSEYINKELDAVGITSNLKGRKYIHDAILFLIQNENSEESVIQYLSKIHQKSKSTISNGIENAIIHGWRVSPIEDLEKNYTAKINYHTGIPTPMELIYYYVEKTKRNA